MNNEQPNQSCNAPKRERISCIHPISSISSILRSSLSWWFIATPGKPLVTVTSARRAHPAPHGISSDNAALKASISGDIAIPPNVIERARRADIDVSSSGENVAHERAGKTDGFQTSYRGRVANRARRALMIARGARRANMTYICCCFMAQTGQRSRGTIMNARVTYPKTLAPALCKHCASSRGAHKRHGAGRRGGVTEGGGEKGLAVGRVVGHLPTSLPYIILLLTLHISLYMLYVITLSLFSLM